MVRQHAGEYGGAGDGECQPDHQPLPPRQAPQVAGSHHDRRGDQALDQRAGHGHLAHCEQLVKLEMQAHPEHQQHDANVRKLFRDLRLGDKAGSEGAADNAGDEVTDDRREPQAVCHPAAEQRGREAHGQVEQQAFAVHRQFPIRGRVGGMESYVAAWNHIALFLAMRQNASP